MLNVIMRTMNNQQTFWNAWNIYFSSFRMFWRNAKTTTQKGLRIVNIDSNFFSLVFFNFQLECIRWSFAHFPFFFSFFFLILVFNYDVSDAEWAVYLTLNNVYAVIQSLFPNGNLMNNYNEEMLIKNFTKPPFTCL